MLVLSCSPPPPFACALNQQGLTPELDQVNDLFQEQIFLRELDRISNKVADILVDTVPAARYNMRVLNLQSGIACHIASDCLAYPIQDHCEIYDVTHHASDIVLAGMQETESLTLPLHVHSPSSIYIIYPIREFV